MPTLNLGESNMAVMPVTYSPSAVARRFEILKEVEIGGTACQIIWDAKLPFAAIINAVPEMIKDEMRHRVIATLELQRRPQLEGVLVKDFWESIDVAQIEGVVVDGVMRDFGLATLMYETIANEAGIVLLSDNEQYAGGKALWQRIAQHSESLTVYILDTDSAKFYPYNGTRVSYDGKSIDESAIWSIHPDRSKHGVVLVAEPLNYDSEDRLTA